MKDAIKVQQAWITVFNRLQNELIEELKQMPQETEFFKAVMVLDSEYCNNEQVYEFLRQNNQYSFQGGSVGANHKLDQIEQRWEELFDCYIQQIVYEGVIDDKNNKALDLIDQLDWLITGGEKMKQIKENI